jgi:uncharacterized protein (DUF2336 family)
MIVRTYLRFVQTADREGRAAAARALAEAYLYGNLGSDERREAHVALSLVLDDPSVMVRQALSEAFAHADEAPISLVLALARDCHEVAAPVLACSPLIPDATLVEAIGSGGPMAEAAVAMRPYVSDAIADLIATQGSPEAAAVLIGNPGADLNEDAFESLAARFGSDPILREQLLQRPDVPASTRHRLMSELADTLAGFVVTCGWLPETRADRVVKDACEGATVALCDGRDRAEVGALVRHLRESGQLTAGLLLRSLLFAETALLEGALTELSGVPATRAAALVNSRSGLGFRALYRKSGLPDSLCVAFEAALDAIHQYGANIDATGHRQLSRGVIERVLTACSVRNDARLEPVVAMLLRHHADIEREEARRLRLVWKREAETATIETDAVDASATTDVVPPHLDMILEGALRRELLPAA